MKQVGALIIKEIYHILRDQRTLLVLFGMPVVQIVLFGFALSNEVKNTKAAILDLSQSPTSGQLVAEIEASKYFDLQKVIYSPTEAEAVLRAGLAVVCIIIPQGFEEELAHENHSQVQLLTDGINPNVATTVTNYLSAIIRDFQERVFEWPDLPYRIEADTRMLYNPELREEFLFVPGIMAFILMLICTLMTAVSIVREKELGNMEVLLVSPMHPLSVIFSKAVPYLFLSVLILSTILLMGVFLLGIPIQGSLALLYLVSILFILAALSIGLAISSIVSSQQSAMMISLLGLMLPTMMLSGFLFPIESMPLPLQILSNVVPAKWYFFSIQDIMIKGLSVEAVTKEMLILTLFIAVFITISVRNFKVRLS
jgi:ABC-2 type transport system permease protein